MKPLYITDRGFCLLVIFFDWDDTCFPSTFLGSNGFGLDTSTDLLGADLAQSLQELETCVVGLLEFAMQCGTVIIVTNAEKGWVELSAKVF